MTTIIDLAQKLESFIEIPIATPVAEVRTKLQEAHKAQKDQLHFALITEGSHPQTLIVEKDLASLTNDQSMPIASVLNQLPPFVVVDRTSTALDVEALILLSRQLKKTKAAGLVVYQNDTMIGVVSRLTIAHALPLSTIPPAKKKLEGDVATPESSYICLKCEEDNPPAPSVLSDKGRVPRCRRHPFEHGSDFMKREDA